MNRIYFQWHITDLCNFRCRHCYQDKFDNAAELDEAGLDQVADNIIEHCRKEKARAVINITGGEPFLNKGLFKLLGYLDNKREIEELLIITNASLINDTLIKELKEIKKLKQIKISLEGSSAASNDIIRGKGSFDKVIKASGLLHNSGYCVTIMFTAMKSNLIQIRDLYTLCKELNVDGLIIERFFPQGNGKLIKDQLLDRNDWFNLTRTLFTLANQDFKEQDSASQRAFWLKFKKGKEELWGADCNVGKDSFCIMPNADVYPCRRFNLKLGNLLETTLAGIINSTLFSDITGLKRKGRCGDCDIPDCQGCPALAYLLRGDYHAQDSQCYYGRLKINESKNLLSSY